MESRLDNNEAGQTIKENASLVKRVVRCQKCLNEKPLFVWGGGGRIFISDMGEDCCDLRIGCLLWSVCLLLYEVNGPRYLSCAGFFLACEDLGRMIDHSFPECASFFFLKWRLAPVH